MRRILKLTPWRPSVVLAFAAAWTIAGATAAGAAEPVALHGRTMGTTYHVKFWRDPDVPEPSGPEIHRAIDALLARFDEQMSTWRSDSELSRFNVAPAGAWFPVSEETARVVERALELHAMTDGASDVTVAPLLRLWGFGPGQKASAGPRQPPSQQEIDAARAHTGADHLHVRADPPALKKDIDGLEVDLSSIAPGYAVDLIVDELASAGVENAMVELGGEVRAVGVRSDGGPWRIGIQSPPRAENAIAQVVPLSNRALTTSGDFHHFQTVGGETLTHILDPRSGRPLVYRGASVTVVAPTCFMADGVATALFVMGTDDGYQWCVDHDVAAYFQIHADDEEAAVRATPRFQDLVKP